MTHDHDHIPDELRPLDRALTREGEIARLEGVPVASRVGERTASMLRPDARPRTLRFPPLWLTLGAPLAAAAALTLIVLNGTPNAGDSHRAPEVVAADLEGAIDVWIELDSRWANDPFHNDIAALSLEAASTAAQRHPTDDVSGLLDTDL